MHQLLRTTLRWLASAAPAAVPDGTAHAPEGTLQRATLSSHLVADSNGVSLQHLVGTSMIRRCRQHDLKSGKPPAIVADLSVGHVALDNWYAGMPRAPLRCRAAPGHRQRDIGRFGTPRCLDRWHHRGRHDHAPPCERAGRRDAGRPRLACLEGRLADQWNVRPGRTRMPRDWGNVAARLARHAGALAWPGEARGTGGGTAERLVVRDHARPVRCEPRRKARRSIFATGSGRAR